MNLLRQLFKRFTDEVSLGHSRSKISKRDHKRSNSIFIKRSQITSQTEALDTSFSKDIFLRSFKVSRGQKSIGKYYCWYFDSPKSRGQINSKIMNMLLTSEILKKIFEFRSLNHIIDMCQKYVSDKVRMVPRMKSKF